MFYIKPDTKHLLLVLLLTYASTSLLAQDSLEKKGFAWNGFAETYYAYNFSKPSNHEKASFLYNHKRHNEVTINLALISLSYKNSATRANIGLMAGTYPEYNLAAEPALLRHIYEASVGFKLTKSKEVWLDAGVLPSHIGFESAISKDCWTLTRSILAENSPYYEAGARVGYKTPSQKWYLAVLLLNGWQRIKRVDGNNTPAVGTQVTYTASDKLTINSSTFTGNDKADSIRKWRYFHNLYAIWQLSNHWGVTAGFDIGFEQKQKASSNLNSWHSPVVILRYQKNSWAVAARIEYYGDNNGVIVPLVNTRPFQMQGYSLNADRIIAKGILFRIEGRLFKNDGAYFINGSRLSANNVECTSSLSITF